MLPYESYPCLASRSWEAEDEQIEEWFGNCIYVDQEEVEKE